MAPSDLSHLKQTGDVAADLLKRLGMNVDYVVTDFGSMLQRRNNTGPVEAGGWSCFVTAWGGMDHVDPAVHQPLRGNGGSPGAWAGSFASPRMEELRQAWFEAPDLAAQQAICVDMQKLGLEQVPYFPLGAFTFSTATRRDIARLAQRVRDVLECAPSWRLRTPFVRDVTCMLSYVIRRVLATIPIMAIVAFFVFSLLYFAPGDPAAVIAGDQANPADVERIRQSLGLDRPFLIRFGEWVWQILHGNLGTSVFSNLPVARVIAERFEPTLSLMAATLLFAVSIAVPTGVVAAWRANTVIDRAIMALAVLGFSVPVFVIAYLLVYGFALQLEWLPVQGYTPLSEGVAPWIRNLILPALALGCVYIALIARTTRAAMLEVLQQDYIRTARAKGIGQTGILFVHALKNAAVPIVTVVGIGFALLIGGAVVTESVFAIPGLGRLTVDAILRRDYPVIQGVVLLFSFVYVIVNLLVDLLYIVLDPRIRY